jgi:hypothetical protein
MQQRCSMGSFDVVGSWLHAVEALTNSTHRMLQRCDGCWQQQQLPTYSASAAAAFYTCSIAELQSLDLRRSSMVISVACDGQHAVPAGYQQQLRFVP